MYHIYVIDARKCHSSARPDALRLGYLSPYAKHAVDGIALDTFARASYGFDTATEAKAAMRELGIADDTSFRTGRLTGYVVRGV